MRYCKGIPPYIKSKKKSSKEGTSSSHGSFEKHPIDCPMESSLLLRFSLSQQREREREESALVGTSVVSPSLGVELQPPWSLPLPRPSIPIIRVALRVCLSVAVAPSRLCLVYTRCMCVCVYASLSLALSWAPSPAALEMGNTPPCRGYVSGMQQPPIPNPESCLLPASMAAN